MSTAGTGAGNGAGGGGGGGGDGSGEDYAKTIKEIMKLPENLVCSDCDAKDPDWASINLGLFMCIKCSGVHRNLGVQISQVRSVDLDTACWNAELCAFMRARGNVVCRKIFEQFAPMYYVRPFETDSALVRENWIRAKYVRREFCADESKNLIANSSPTGKASIASASDAHRKPNANPCVIRMPERVKEGWLMKANKKGVWQKRWFILIGRFLEYYKTPDATTPKGSLDLSTVSLKVPDTIDAAHRYRWEVKSTKKSYPLCADKEDDMFAWLHAIRRANVFYYTTDADAKTPAPVDPLPLGRIGKPTAAGMLSSPGGLFGLWGQVYAAIGPNANALFLYRAAPDGKAPPDTTMPDVTIGLDQSEVMDVSLKLQKKFAFAIVRPGRIHFFTAQSQVELVEFTGALLNSIDAHNERVDFDFQLNRVHTPNTPASPKAKPSPAAAAAASPKVKPLPSPVSSPALSPVLSPVSSPASPKASAASSSSDGKSVPTSPTGAATAAGAAGAGAGKAPPPIPAKGTKPAPPIPRGSKPAVVALQSQSSQSQLKPDA